MGPGATESLFLQARVRAVRGGVVASHDATTCHGGMTTQQVLSEGGDGPRWRRGVAWRHDFATVSEPPARLAHFRPTLL